MPSTRRALRPNAPVDEGGSMLWTIVMILIALVVTLVNLLTGRRTVV
jgi:hypothetical protein